MLLQVPEVLTKAEVAQIRAAIDGGPWIDGNVTSGFQSALAKRNDQLDPAADAGRRAGEVILGAVKGSLLFSSAALPRAFVPPLFNRYGPGQDFDTHIDSSIRAAPGREAIRTDLSATLFLSEPDGYDGGELVIEDTYGAHAVKLAAGDLILYPASSLHHVTPVTRGERVASFFWVQSYVRAPERRALLFDMDLAIQNLALAVGQKDPSIIALTGGYHNLLRMWAEV